MTAPTFPTRQQTVLLITVSLQGDVSAKLKETPTPDYYDGHFDVTTSETLDEFLNHTTSELHDGTPIARVLPPDTPIVRFDRVSIQTACEFSLRGPIPRAQLPEGSIEPLDEPVRPYNGETWSNVGGLTYVSLDVYVQLADQAGVIVERIGDDPHPS